MLFDLQSPGRRRVVRVVFGTLAAIFAISFVFFGVGSGINGFGGDGGGLLDALGIGGSDTPDNPFSDDIDDAKKQLEANPNDTAALSELVALHYQAGTKFVDIDPETQQTIVTSDAEDEFQQAADSWNRYVKVVKKPDPSTAGYAFQVFSTLASSAIADAQQSTSTTEALTKADAAIANWKGAAQAGTITADSDPVAAAYLRVASLLYLAGDTKGAEEAGNKALAAAEPDEKKPLEAQLKAAEKQGAQFNEAIAKIRKQDQKQQEQFGGDQGNPLESVGGGGALGGGLSGSGTTLSP